MPLLLLAGGSVASASRIDWQDGNWNGGTANGYTSGSATGTTNGGGVTVNWAHFGTADGLQSGLGGIQPRILQTVGDGLDGVLTLGTKNDRNTTSLLNYTTLTITFANLVDLANGALTIQDLDSNGATSWQDFVAVKAFKGANTVGVTYGILAAHALTTSFALDGVRGIQNIANSGATQANANVGVNFGGDLDKIVLYFFQGPLVTSGTGAEHGVWLKDIDYTAAVSPVPEPSTVALALAGSLGMLFLRRKKKQA
ncbi:MAG: PEP-CTERM sorting domain-containing protein [Candidatus Solibacter sp.]